MQLKHGIGDIVEGQFAEVRRTYFQETENYRRLEMTYQVVITKQQLRLLLQHLPLNHFWHKYMISQH